MLPTSQYICQSQFDSGSSKEGRMPAPGLSSISSCASKRTSISCPTCNTEWINIPTDIIVDEAIPNDPPRSSRRWSRRPAWISRPLNRKAGDLARSQSRQDNTLELDLGAPRGHRRRPSSVLSDSSSQTCAESPGLRSILSGASSVSSKGTLHTKRSVKFSEEAVVYYDYTYSDPCDHVDKYGCEVDYDYELDCDGYFDMFSFEQTEEIPSEKRWGIWSRIFAWFRRVRGKNARNSEYKGRPSISRPLPLGIQMPVPRRKERDKQVVTRNAPTPRRATLKKFSCT